jgi:hypothetical protein
MHSFFSENITGIHFKSHKNDGGTVSKTNFKGFCQSEIPDTYCRHQRTLLQNRTKHYGK